VCVCERERERVRECARERERECARVRERVCVRERDARLDETVLVLDNGPELPLATGGRQGEREYVSGCVRERGGECVSERGRRAP